MTMFRLIASDFACIKARDPAARGRLEIALCYPGLHAAIGHRFAHALWQAGARFPARFLSYLTRAVTGIDIHPGAKIGPGFFIDHGQGVVIGETAVVGANVTLYHGVTLGGVSWSPGKRHPTLGDGVMVGAGAKILGPVTLGEGVRVGANSVVVSDVPADCTVIGVPARIVRAELPAARNPLRIDLNHHLIPDPVGRSLAGLADRIAFLEARLAESRASRDEAARASFPGPGGPCNAPPDRPRH